MPWRLTRKDRDFLKVNRIEVDEAVKLYTPSELKRFLEEENEEDGA